MTITIVGTGLIGGSMALALRAKKFAAKIIGVDANEVHALKALELQLVDQVMSLDKAIAVSDLIIVAVPMDAATGLIRSMLPKLSRQVIMDVGSTKGDLCHQVEDLKGRGRFVATHPMWGTEHSGPEAAVHGAFREKAVVICDKELSDDDALDLVNKLYACLEMHILYMSAKDHDLHAAYVSHISHISSFALANTVLEKEKEDNAIFEMASAGFESTVRLAKSNVEMWVPIFMQNKENVLDVLNEHISQLRKFKSCLEKENYEYLADLINHANRIKRILK